MGVVFEMCYCVNNKAIVPNSKSMIENDINNKYDNNINEISNNVVGEKNKKKIINGIVEQNNDAETYNNVSSKGVLLTPKKKKENISIKKKEKKEDKLSQKGSENQKIDENKKKKRKKSKNKNVEKNSIENFESSKKSNIVNIGEDYKEIVISETVLSEIVLNEKLKTISKDRKKKMKGRNNINIVIIGSNEVGKSSFCIRFVENKFEDFYIPSIGIENYTKLIAYNIRSYKLFFSVIWGGIVIQKQDNLLSEADFFFLIYDITKIRSFNQINIYLKQLKKYLFLYDKEGKSPNFCLIGNKCDLEGERRVGLEVVNKCIDKYKIKHFDISVKTANNMNNLIQFFVNIFDKIAFSDK